MPTNFPPGSTAPAPAQIGDTWYDSINAQDKVFTNTGWVSIGSTGVSGANIAVQSLSILASGPYNPSALAYAGGQVWGTATVMAPPPNGTDDTTVLSTLVGTANRTILLQSGIYKISSVLTFAANVALIGAPGNSTQINAVAGWSGTTMILIQNNNCIVRGINFQPGASATYSLNPAADCITVQGANNVWLESLTGYYWNGWFINAIPNGTASPFTMFMSNIVGTQGKQGIHLQGGSAGSHSVAAMLSNILMNHMQAGDALFIDGAHDVLAFAFNAVLDSGANAFSCIHVKGTSAGIFLIAADCGGISGGAYTGTSYLIERDASLNRPNNVQFIGGITSNQGVGMSVDCDDFTCESHTFLQSQTDGVQIKGAGTNLSFVNNRYQQSNLSAGTAYDVNCSNTTGRIKHYFDFFESTATTASINAQLNMEVRNCWHAHTTQAWASNTPVHSQNTGAGTSLPTTPGSPAVPATTVAQANNRQADCIVYVTAGAGSTCAVAINGQAVATLPASGVGSFAVPQTASITLTYTSAPTWVWEFAIAP